MCQATRDLYFEDLRKIINKHWDTFRHIFGPDQNVFSRRMETVNKYRADAHATNISMEELTFFRLSINALEEQIGEFIS